MNIILKNGDVLKTEENATCRSLNRQIIIRVHSASE